jgi:hypothetical protein
MHRSGLLLGMLLMAFSATAQIASIELADKPVPEPITRNLAVENWNNAQKGFKTLSSQAKEFLYWVNLGRTAPQQFWDSAFLPVAAAFPELTGQDARSLYQDLVKTGPLPMFALNANLVASAQAHAADISGNNKPASHNSSDGTNFGVRIKKAGIRFCAGENIAISSHSVLMSVILLYLDIGLPEKGHRKSLLNPNYRETGIGSAVYGKDQFFLVQDLSCAQ